MSENRYVLVNSQGEYIGIDYHSGGYSYRSKSIFDCKIWHDPVDAWKYRNSMNKSWSLHQIEIKSRLVSAEEVTGQQYQEELAALNRKYGIN